MLTRSPIVLILTFGFAGILHAQEELTPASIDQLEAESVSLTSSADYTDYGGYSSQCAGYGSSECGYSRWNVEGWLDAGFLLNGNQSPSGFHGPYNQTDRHEGSLNQAYLVLERRLANDRLLSIGGRVDVLYGTDAFLAESKGFERNQDGSAKWNGDHYGLAFPQAYGEIGNDRLSFKIGHFYTIVGYESVPAVNNFFYSKCLSYMFAQPFVQWGGLASWKASDRLSFDAGIVNGWDALERVADRPAFLGRVSWNNDKDPVWTSFAIIAGDELDQAGTASTSRARYSFIVGANLTCRLQYVFHHWYGYQDAFFPTGNSAEWYGVDQYLYYQLTPCLRLGGRFEWFRDDDGVRLGLSRPSNPNNNPFVGNMYSVSVGLNWTPWDNIMLRPEMRYDWYDGAGLPFNDGISDNQFLVGLDAIWRF